MNCAINQSAMRPMNIRMPRSVLKITAAIIGTMMNQKIKVCIRAPYSLRKRLSKVA